MGPSGNGQVTIRQQGQPAFDFDPCFPEKDGMRKLGFLLAALLLCGCAVHKRGTSISDPYESATIDQMTGNNVSGAVFARTIVCLNARRETRTITALTNQTVALVTNVSVSYLTNQTVTLTTNQLATLATNETPPLTLPAPANSETNARQLIGGEGD